MNDLHTAALTAEIAHATGAAALVNAGLDRNLVDLNRVSAACAHAPRFLERLAALLGAALARHGRAVLLAVHGWNVVQPVVDLGTGARAGVADAYAAVSPAFAATAVPALRAALAAAGIGTTVGARYPARARENLLQLFTRRYRDDSRPVVRALAALADRVEAVQLELGIPLRWPGPWRARLVAALARAAPALAVAGAATAELQDVAPAARARGHALEFVAGALAGTVRLDAQGGRLLILPRDGDLLLFTGDAAAARRPGEAGVLEAEPTAGGGLRVRYAGPLLRLPDSTAFLDLERGLERAALGEGTLDLTLTGGTGFGRVHGRARIDGAVIVIDGHGFAGQARPDPGAGGGLRLSLRLDGRTGLALAAPAEGGPAHGHLHRDGAVVPVERAQVRLGAAALAHLHVDAEVPGGPCLRLRAAAAREVPVARRGLLATLRLPGQHGLAGWAELAHPLPFSS
ncbi:MAG TPA: hypothetical protein VKW76_10585 [Candidatus Binatia bacterium]|nr:hypothetical protein [Candidatus Binatia bacterium]